MFQRLIFNIIQSVKKLYEKLDTAYQQTYTDKRISNDIKNEIKKRKESNKKLTLDKLALYLQKRYHLDTGDNMPYDVAQEFAKEFFIAAKIRGDIDEMNNLLTRLD